MKNRYRLLLLVPALFASALSQAGPMIMTAAEWAQPRNGNALIRHPVLAGSVAQLIEQPQSRLLLRYPGGDEGKLWVHELKAWLVALGVESSRIELRPGGDAQQISFQVLDTQQTRSKSKTSTQKSWVIEEEF